MDVIINQEEECFHNLCVYHITKMYTLNILKVSLSIIPQQSWRGKKERKVQDLSKVCQRILTES